MSLLKLEIFSSAPFPSVTDRHLHESLVPPHYSEPFDDNIDDLALE